MTELSIIIVNYNTFALTCRCIESVYAFTKGISFEIILVDNASTEVPADEFLKVFPKIVLIKRPVNEGFAKGNNRGIEASSGDVILLLNSDTELTSNAIGNACKKLRSLPEVGVITVKLVYPDGRVQHQCGRFPSLTLQVVELFRLQKLMTKERREKLLLGGFFDHQRDVYPDWIWGTFFMFKREVLISFPGGKLPETYFMYQEDLEWCYWISKTRYRIYYLASESVIHIFSGSSVNPVQNKAKKQNLENNLNHFLRTHYGSLFTGLYTTLHRVNRLLQRR